MQFHLTVKSGNVKTGPIPVSTSDARTCPTSCGMYQVCYAKSGPLSIHWKQVSKGTRGTSWDVFCSQVANIPEGQIWRHNQAGDLPGIDGTIDTPMLRQLVNANRGKRGFTYTHKPMTRSNAAAVKHANEHGFTINLSADSLEIADTLAALKIAPVTVVLPVDAPHKLQTPADRTVIKCPAQTTDGMTCEKCGLCAIATRKAIIGFEAHDAKKNQIK